MGLDLFINYDGEIDDIAEKIGELLGIELIKNHNEFGVIYKFIAFNIEFLLYGEHGMEDDQGIAFTDYNYQMQLIKLRIGEKYKMYNAIYENMARFLTEKLAYDLGARTMLVENLSKVVFSAVPAVART